MTAIDLGLDQVDRNFKAQKKSTRRWSMFLSQLLVATHTVCYWKSTCGGPHVPSFSHVPNYVSLFISWFLLLNSHLDSRKPRVSQLERKIKKKKKIKEIIKKSRQRQGNMKGNIFALSTTMLVTTAYSQLMAERIK